MFKTSRWLLASVLSLALFGCRSLSPEEDLREASNLLKPRIGFAPGWGTSSFEDPWNHPLTLTEAVRVAVRNHPEIRMDLARVARRRADLVQAGLLPNPVVSLGFGIPVDSGGGTPASHGVIQQLAALWNRPVKIAAAQADLRATVLNLCESTVALAATVGSTMAALHHGRNQLSLSSREVQLLTKRVELLLDRERAGEATRLEINAARVDLARAREREVDDQESLAVDRRRMLERLGSKRFAFEIEAFDFSTLPSLEDGIPLETDLLELVATQRLDVVAAFTALDGDDARTRLASWFRSSGIGAGVGYNRNFEDRDAVVPTVQLTPPLFDLGRAATAKAEAIERRSQAEADRILNQAVLEVRVAHVALTQATERRLRVDSDLLLPLRENHRLAAQTYEVGEETLSEVLRNEAQLLEAERRHESAALASRIAYFELVRAAGGSLQPIEEREER